MDFDLQRFADANVTIRSGQSSGSVYIGGDEYTVSGSAAEGLSVSGADGVTPATAVEGEAVYSFAIGDETYTITGADSAIVITDSSGNAVSTGFAAASIDGVGYAVTYSDSLGVGEEVSSAYTVTLNNGDVYSINDGVITDSTGASVTGNITAGTFTYTITTTGDPVVATGTGSASISSDLYTHTFEFDGVQYTINADNSAVSDGTNSYDIADGTNFTIDNTTFVFDDANNSLSVTTTSLIGGEQGDAYNYFVNATATLEAGVYQATTAGGTYTVTISGTGDSNTIVADSSVVTLNAGDVYGLQAVTVDSANAAVTDTLKTYNFTADGVTYVVNLTDGVASIVGSTVASASDGSFTVASGVNTTVFTASASSDSVTYSTVTKDSLTNSENSVRYTVGGSSDWVYTVKDAALVGDAVASLKSGGGLFSVSAGTGDTLGITQVALEDGTYASLISSNVDYDITIGGGTYKVRVNEEGIQYYTEGDNTTKFYFADDTNAITVGTDDDQRYYALSTGTADGTTVAAINAKTTGHATQNVDTITPDVESYTISLGSVTGAASVIVTVSTAQTVFGSGHDDSVIAAGSTNVGDSTLVSVIGGEGYTVSGFEVSGTDGGSFTIDGVAYSLDFGTGENSLKPVITLTETISGGTEIHSYAGEVSIGTAVFNVTLDGSGTKFTNVAPHEGTGSFITLDGGEASVAVDGVNYVITAGSNTYVTTDITSRDQFEAKQDTTGGYAYTVNIGGTDYQVNVADAANITLNLSGQSTNASSALKIDGVNFSASLAGETGEDAEATLKPVVYFDDEFEAGNLVPKYGNYSIVLGTGSVDGGTNGATVHAVVANGSVAGGDGVGDSEVVFGENGAFSIAGIGYVASITGDADNVTGVSIVEFAGYTLDGYTYTADEAAFVTIGSDAAYVTVKANSNGSELIGFSVQGGTASIANNGSSTIDIGGVAYEFYYSDDDHSGVGASIANGAYTGGSINIKELSETIGADTKLTVKIDTNGSISGGNFGTDVGSGIELVTTLESGRASVAIGGIDYFLGYNDDKSAVTLGGMKGGESANDFASDTIDLADYTTTINIGGTDFEFRYDAAGKFDTINSLNKEVATLTGTPTSDTFVIGGVEYSLSHDLSTGVSLGLNDALSNTGSVATADQYATLSFGDATIAPDGKNGQVVVRIVKSGDDYIVEDGDANDGYDVETIAGCFATVEVGGEHYTLGAVGTNYQITIANDGSIGSFSKNEEATSTHYFVSIGSGVASLDYVGSTFVSLGSTEGVSINDGGTTAQISIGGLAYDISSVTGTGVTFGEVHGVDQKYTQNTYELAFGSTNNITLTTESDGTVFKAADAGSAVTSVTAGLSGNFATIGLGSGADSIVYQVGMNEGVVNGVSIIGGYKFDASTGYIGSESISALSPNWKLTLDSALFNVTVASTGVTGFDSISDNTYSGLTTIGTADNKGRIIYGGTRYDLTYDTINNKLSAAAWTSSLSSSNLGSASVLSYDSTFYTITGGGAGGEISLQTAGTSAASTAAYAVNGSSWFTISGANDSIFTYDGSGVSLLTDGASTNLSPANAYTYSIGSADNTYTISGTSTAGYSVKGSGYTNWTNITGTAFTVSSNIGSYESDTVAYRFSDDQLMAQSVTGSASVSASYATLAPDGYYFSTITGNGWSILP